MDCEKRQTLSDVVASVISEGSDNESLNLTESYALKFDEEPPHKVMKIKRYQLHPKTYSPKWELDPNYKGWVQRSKKGDGFYYCLACNQDYTCGKSELDKHASSRKHCINVMSLPKQTGNGDTNNQRNVSQSHYKSCDSFEPESILVDPGDIDTSSSGSFQVSSFESKEEAFGQYIISELKRIKKKKTYEFVKWEILQSLQKAILQETETEDSES